jgi:hypothetical protein
MQDLSMDSYGSVGELLSEIFRKDGVLRIMCMRSTNCSSRLSGTDEPEVGQVRSKDNEFVITPQGKCIWLVLGSTECQ